VGQSAPRFASLHDIAESVDSLSNGIYLIGLRWPRHRHLGAHEHVGSEPPCRGRGRAEIFFPILVF
jgi:hypothetical protein